MYFSLIKLSAAKQSGNIYYLKEYYNKNEFYPKINV